MRNSGPVPMDQAPTATTVLGELPVLSQTDFPNVRNWKKSDWTASQSSGQTDLTDDGDAAQNLSFCEDEAGNPMGSAVITHVRSVARWSFGFLDQDKNNPPPATWATHANIEHRRKFYADLYREFPWLAYCENHWKVEQVAIEQYPAYRYSRALPTERAKSKKGSGKGKKRQAPMSEPDEAPIVASASAEAPIVVSASAEAVHVQTTGLHGKKRPRAMPVGGPLPPSNLL